MWVKLKRLSTMEKMAASDLITPQIASAPAHSSLDIFKAEQRHIT